MLAGLSGGAQVLHSVLDGEDVNEGLGTPEGSVSLRSDAPWGYHGSLGSLSFSLSLYGLTTCSLQHGVFNVTKTSYLEAQGSAGACPERERDRGAAEAGLPFMT